MFEDRTMLDPAGQPGPVNPNQTQWLDPSAAPPVAWSGVDATQQAISITCAVCETPNMPGERWCQDCGFLLGSTPAEVAELPDPSTMPRLVAQADGGKEFVLQPGPNTVGRENADVLLFDNQVSRAHARLTLQGNGLTLEDLGSTNGSRVAGRKLAAGESAPVFDGDEVRFGTVVLRAVIPGGSPRPPELQAQPAAAPAAPRTDRGEPVARFVRDDGTELPLYAGTNTVGRRSDNDICLTGDPFVSGRHAEIRCEGTAVTVTDLGSTNGTFLAGERLPAGDTRPLDESSELKIGKTALQLRLAGAPAEATTVFSADELPGPDEIAAAGDAPPADATAGGAEEPVREIVVE